MKNLFNYFKLGKVKDNDLALITMNKNVISFIQHKAWSTLKKEIELKTNIQNY